MLSPSAKRPSAPPLGQLDVPDADTDQAAVGAEQAPAGPAMVRARAVTRNGRGAAPRSRASRVPPRTWVVQLLRCVARSIPTEVTTVPGPGASSPTARRATKGSALRPRTRTIATSASTSRAATSARTARGQGPGASCSLQAEVVAVQLDEQLARPAHHVGGRQDERLARDRRDHRAAALRRPPPDQDRRAEGAVIGRHGPVGRGLPIGPQQGHRQDRRHDPGPRALRPILDA